MSFVPKLKPSQAAVSRAFKVPQTTISYRVRNLGVTPLRAAQMPHRLRDALALKAREHGLKPDTLRRRVRRMQERWPQLPVSEIVERALRRPLRPWGKVLTRTAREVGMAPSTLHRRLVSGMSLTDALTKPIDLSRVSRSDPRRLTLRAA